jgi:hypothetical protein
MQELATEAVRKNLAEMERIASGQPRVVWDEGEQQERVLIPYPRDQIAALKVLQDAARYRVLPQKAWPGTSSAAEDETDTYEGGLMPIFAANPNFSRIEGTAPDGTEIVVNVGDPIDPITEADGDAEEDQARL